QAGSRWISGTVQGIPTADLLAGAVGLLIGLILALLITLPLPDQIPLVGPYLPLAITAILGYTGWTVGVKKREELVQFFRLPAGTERAAPGGSARALGRSWTPASSSMGGSPTSAPPASSRARWWCPGSCWRSSSTSRTAPTSSSGIGDGGGWMCSSGCRRSRRPWSRGWSGTSPTSELQ